MLDRPAEYERMALVEGQHWWYRTLHEQVLAALKQHGVSTQDVIIDAGCGTGGLLQFLKAQGFGAAQGFDLSPHAVTFAQARGLTVAAANLLELDRFVAPHSAKAVIANDVLYFFEGQELHRALAVLHRMLSPNGVLIANVPAFACFAGIHDLSVGIPKRFTPKRWQHDLLACGLQLRQWTCWPFLLAPAIAWQRTRQRHLLRCNPATTIESDSSLPPPWLNRLLYGLMRCERACLPWRPWGSSIFSVSSF